MSRSDSSIFHSARRVAGLAAGAAAIIAAPALAGDGVASAQLVAHDAPAPGAAVAPHPTGRGGDTLLVPAPVVRPPLVAESVSVAITNSSERASRSSSRHSLKPKPTRSTSSGSSSTSSNPKAIAQSMLAARGWSGQFSCLNSLWTKESGWKVSASNPSGAYGIPQSLPGSKMASAGSNWQTNPATQITWGLNYIADNWY
jgi:hypothetical protein